MGLHEGDRTRVSCAKSSQPLAKSFERDLRAIRIKRQPLKIYRANNR